MNKNSVNVEIRANQLLNEDGEPEYTESYSYKTYNYYDIYDKVSELLPFELDNDEVHNIASDAASWCELAAVGEKYEILDGFLLLEIVEQ